MSQFSKSTKILSVLLVVCMVFSLAANMLPNELLTTEAEAIYHEDNAPVASWDLLTATENTFFMRGSSGYRIVDGVLYVWGSNSGYALGLAGADTSTKEPSPVVLEPEGGWDGQPIKVSGAGLMMCLTSTGAMYAWGSMYTTYFGGTFGNPVPTPKQLDTRYVPEGDKIVDFSSGSQGVVAITEQGRAFVAGNGSFVNNLSQTSAGSTYIFRPVSERWIDMFQESYEKTYTPDTENGEDASYKVRTESEREGGNERRVIKKMLFSDGYTSCFYQLNDGTLWASGGAGGYAQQLLGMQSSSSYPQECVTIAGNEEWAAAKPRFDETMYAGPSVTATIDAEGSVWVGGHNYGLYDPSGNYWDFEKQYEYTDPGPNHGPVGEHSGAFPKKVYDATMTGVKCTKIYSDGSSLFVFLTEDNSLYAIGKNSNQFITKDVDDGYPVFEPTQVFAELSAQYTITGVYATSNGVMVVTKSGDQFWAGDNSNGTAGNGSTEKGDPGEVTQSIPQTLPPVQPLTTNELIFEIETADGTRYRYDPTYDNAVSPNGCSMTVYPSDGTAAYTSTTRIELNAGSLIKLNIYFNDFGRLNMWEVPIRFDPKYLQVSRGDGTAYEDSKVVTPGALGDSVGIVKQFTNSQWTGGAMVGPSVKSGGYPKICNGEGWVSLAGYTEDKSAKINGEVKMATVYFTAKDKMDATATAYFSIANKDNLVNDGVTGFGYDDGMTAGDYGAQWCVLSLLDDGKHGLFDFTYAKANDNAPLMSPAFHTAVTPISNLGLVVKSADGAAVPAKEFIFPMTQTTTYTYQSIAQISSSNKVANFTVETNITPDGTTAGSLPASFPQVNWTYEVAKLPEAEKLSSGMDTDPDSPTYGQPLPGWQLSDFITILSENTSQVKFKVSDDYPLDGDGIGQFPVVIKFTATPAYPSFNTGVSPSSIMVVLRSYEPPKAVAITEAQTLTDNTVIWKDLDGSLPNEPSRTFHCDFPGTTEGYDQLDVVWTLRDSSGNILTGLSSDYAKLGTPAPANSGKYKTPVSESEPYEAPNVTVDTQHTTFGDEYITLRVESAYDGSVYDEVKIKIHQRVTSITWKKDKLYMLEGGDSVDLNTMISVAPVGEYYESNLNFVYVPNASNTGNQFLYVNPTSGVVQPMYVSTINEKVVFDQIYVKDTLSNVSTLNNTETPEYLNVAVISVKSPIKAEHVDVHNLLGTKADYARVYNLEEGDSIIFFDDYDDWSGKIPGSGTTAAEFNSKLTTIEGLAGHYKRFNNLTKDQIGNMKLYDFPLPDFLDGQGGDLGIVVLRYVNEDDTTQTVYDMVPVHYLSDPSKVYGYVQTLGREPNSYQNRNITVKLVGPSTPAAISTGANGYFVFQEYIIPGEYSMTISKDGYLTRTIQADAATGYRGIVITEALEFAISTYEDPIYLYPGDLDNNGSINASDISNYVRNWYGQTDYINIYDFAKYDFYELDGRNAINMWDLSYVVTHNGWSKTNYAKWNVPTVS